MNTTIRRNVIATTVLVSSVFGASLAFGQTLPTTGVPEVASPLIDTSYAPKGLPLGGFRLFPTLDLALDWDDNVYRTETAPQASTLFEIMPRLALQSEWAQHYLVLRGGLTDYQYTRFTRESRIDWDLTGEGRLDILRELAFLGGVSYRHTYEPRSSPDQLTFAKSPTPYDVILADGRFQWKPNRLTTTVGFNFSRYTYGVTKLLPTGTSSNRDRNYTQWEGYGRLAYEFSPGYSAYGHFSYNVRDFETAIDRNGVNRDSTGFRANGGVQMELTRLITGEFYGGYQSQKYKFPLSHDTGFNYGANIEWSPTPLILVNLQASHQINETVVSSIAGVATDSNEQRVALGVNYGFRRNIILRADASYLHDNFKDSGRVDDVWVFGAGATYLINQYMNASLRYEHNSRRSTAPLQDYTDNFIRFAIGLQI